jgi:hypothetical protein
LRISWGKYALYVYWSADSTGSLVTDRFWAANLKEAMSLSGQLQTVKREKCCTFERRVPVGKLPLRQREIVLECFE